VALSNLSHLWPYYHLPYSSNSSLTKCSSALKSVTCSNLDQNIGCTMFTVEKFLSFSKRIKKIQRYLILVINFIFYVRTAVTSILRW
jgi:hypothetical protein